MDTEDDARYPRIAYGNQSYGSSSRQKLTGRNTSSFTHNGNARYVEVNDIDEDDENVDDEEDEDHEENGVQRLSYEDEDDEEDDYGDMQRHPKKRKLKSLLSSYEFAPRVPPPPSAAVSKSAFGGRNSVADWSEHETFILLDAWGDKFLQHGRKSLRSEEWHDVAEKVSQDSKIDRTDSQCRNRLDTLKKKYKKEKAKLSGSGGSLVSRWVYFKKMDTLMCSQPQQSGLSCGVDSGEYVFMNPKDYLNRANGLDEMRDSPGNSESADGNEDDDDDDDEEEEEEEEDSEGLPPRKNKKKKNQEGNGISFKLLADSIQKFSDIYEKIENSKRQQMLELEQMRMDFHRDLELQKRQILESAQAEIAKIREGDDDDDEDDDDQDQDQDQDDEEQNGDDVSAENISG